MTIRPLREGRPLIWSGDFATVVLSVERIADANRFYVETRQGGIVEAWTRTYTREHLAREAAARAAHAFKTHGTVEAIERHRNGLAIDLKNQQDRRRRGMHSQTRIDALVRELDRLADLNDAYAALAAA